jgi:signal transduction histidine kinase
LIGRLNRRLRPRLFFQFFHQVFYQWRIGAAVGWLLFTGALALWWMYFATSLLPEKDPLLANFRRMLILEGITLLIFLLAGGGTLIYLILREQRQRQLLQDFFATFSHEVKTALASLRLQAESLLDAKEAPTPKQKTLLNRLLTDTTRLLVFVQNALYVAEGPRAYLGSVSLVDVLKELQLSWPHMKIELQGLPHGTSDLSWSTDRKLLLTVLQNLVHNAHQHGAAKAVWIQVQDEGSRLCFLVTDDGTGFKGDTRLLGLRGHRPTSTSGTGLGLYIVKNVLRQLRGEGPCFTPSSGLSNSGFSVSFSLPRTPKDKAR